MPGTRPEHTLTPKQFRDRIVRQCMREFAVPRRRAEEVHSEAGAYRKHFDAVYSAAGRGEVIPAIVLDRIGEGRRNKLFHDWPGSIPAGYLTPEARRLNRDRRHGR